MAHLRQESYVKRGGGERERERESPLTDNLWCIRCTLNFSKKTHIEFCLPKGHLRWLHPSLAQSKKLNREADFNGLSAVVHISSLFIVCPLIFRSSLKVLKKITQKQMTVCLLRDQLHSSAFFTLPSKLHTHGKIELVMGALPFNPSSVTVNRNRSN